MIWHGGECGTGGEVEIYETHFKEQGKKARETGGGYFHWGVCTKKLLGKRGAEAIEQFYRSTGRKEDWGAGIKIEGGLRGGGGGRVGCRKKTIINVPTRFIKRSPRGRRWRFLSG